MAKFHKVDMPDFWASYLINGDASGLEPGDQEHIDAYLDQQEIAEVVDVEEDSERFTWSYDLYGGTAQGGTVATYTVALAKRKTRK